eukprot:jgi/Undpi1/10395/HiC_scaffold_29.g12845.m1
MSALFDDAERFESTIVVGDTLRRVKRATDEYVGPGTYSPSLASFKEFGETGVSKSRRSTMDPPLSARSSEHQRHANGSVVRDGVWFHTSSLLTPGPGPGSYSPAIISRDHGRGRTAKPSSGQAGRQAWDLRGSAGGFSVQSFRDGWTVSPSMGNSPRIIDSSRVALRDGVLLLRGPFDGHRSNGIGPGTYDGVTNRQDPLTKRSYNVRAQTSQVRRERSLSFSGTSSVARAFLSLRPCGTPEEATAGRPDLHLVTRHPTSPGPGPAGGAAVSPSRERRERRRCASPANSARSLSPTRTRGKTSGYSFRAGGFYSTLGYPQESQSETTSDGPDEKGFRWTSPPPPVRTSGGVGAASGRRSWGGGNSGSPSRTLQRGAWHGLDIVAAAREAAGIEVPCGGSPATGTGAGAGTAGGEAEAKEEGWPRGGRGSPGSPGSLLQGGVVTTRDQRASVAAAAAAVVPADKVQDDPKKHSDDVDDAATEFDETPLPSPPRPPDLLP